MPVYKEATEISIGCFCSTCFSHGFHTASTGVGGAPPVGGSLHLYLFPACCRTLQASFSPLVCHIFSCWWGNMVSHPRLFILRAEHILCAGFSAHVYGCQRVPALHLTSIICPLPLSASLASPLLFLPSQSLVFCLCSSVFSISCMRHLSSDLPHHHISADARSSPVAPQCQMT